MSSSLVIDAVENLHTGTTAQVTLSGTPAGAVTFWAGRTIDEDGAIIIPHSGSGPYVITVPHPGLWFIWAQDNNGKTASFDSQGEPVLSACNINVSDDDIQNQIGNFLRILLWNSKQGLEAFLRTDFPGTTIKQSHYGFPSGINLFPSIIVTNPRFRWEWAANRYCKHYTYSFTIAGMIVHEDEQTFMPMALKFGEAIGILLNQPAYHTIDLPSGIQLYYCQSVEGEATEVELGEGLFGAIGTQVWSAEAQLQDTGA